jgi:hypothetical protein
VRKKSKRVSTPYLTINYTLAGIILLVFLYSGIFSARKDNYPLPSFYEEITGDNSPSTGLSKSFSEIIRGNFHTAAAYNKHGMLIFGFFLVQLVMRLAASLLLLRRLVQQKWLARADILLSLLMFIYCFREMLLFYVDAVTS